MSGPTIDRAASSGDIWTPWKFIAAVQKKFGYLDWDLAASEVNRRATNWIDEAQNSLTVDWHELGGLQWLNPPYSNIAPWAMKCAAQSWRPKVDTINAGAQILLLVPGSIGANWYWNWVEPYADVYSIGRLVFDNCFDRKTGAPVKTTYPKDLILCHYYNRQSYREMKRWRWEEDGNES
jgi:phage N-6-adenine-methyltransferase